MQQHDLRASRQALTSERDQLGLRVTPVAERRRPFRRPAKVEDLLAGLDDGAVDDPDDDRGQLARVDGGHRLVQQAGPVLDRARPDQGLASAEPGESDQVGVTEALTDRAGLSEGGVCGLGVALAEGPERGGQQEKAPFHAVATLVLEQSASPGDPTAAAGPLARHEELEAQPERAAGGALRLTPVVVLVVRAPPDLRAFAIASEQVRDGGQSFEILGRQRGLSVRVREPGEGIGPGPAFEGFPALIECVGSAHRVLSRWERSPALRGSRVAVRPLGRKTRFLR